MSHTFRLLLLIAVLALLSACGETANVAAGDGPVQDQRTYQWKMITSWPRNLPALGTNPDYFARLVEDMSGGRMQIQVFGANELVGGLEVFDAVSQGVAEIGNSTPYYWQGKIPGASFFSTVPLVLTPRK
ncbi:MAG: hypothetical protein ACE37N_11460 [Pseudohongiellaceae bacterium]